MVNNDALESLSWAAEAAPNRQSTPKTGPSLLDLPLELRLMIYDLIDEPLNIKVSSRRENFPGERSVFIRKDPTKKNLVHPAFLKNLSRVCRQLHWELKQAVQGGQTFQDYVLANYVLCFHRSHAFIHMVDSPEYKFRKATKIQIDFGNNTPGRTLVFPDPSDVSALSFFSRFSSFLWNSAIKEISFKNLTWLISPDIYSHKEKPHDVLVQRVSDGWCFEFTVSWIRMRAPFVAAFERYLRGLGRTGDCEEGGKNFYLKK